MGRFRFDGGNTAEVIPLQKEGGRPVPVSPVGVTGLKRNGGFIYDEFHRRLRGRKGLEIFREMSDNDAVVGSILYALEMYAQQAEITFTPADDSNQAAFYADYTDGALRDMGQTVPELISDVMSFAWAGHSAHEIVYKLRKGPGQQLPSLRSKFSDGNIGWRGFPIRAQDTIDQWKFDQKGNVLGFWQIDPVTGKRSLIEFNGESDDGRPTQAILFRTRSNKSNPEGRSLLRNAYRSWWFLKRIEELEAIGVERDMAGLLVIKLPIEVFNDATQTAKFRKIAERARRGEYDGLLFPTDTDADGPTGYNAELMQSGGRRPMDVDGIIKRLQSRMALSVLAEGPLLGMQGNVGSWSLASTKTHMFAMMLNGLLRQIEETFNRHAAPRLMEANAWPVELSPTMSFGDVEQDDVEALMASITAAAGPGWFEAGPATEEWIRAKRGIPQEEIQSLTDDQLDGEILALKRRDHPLAGPDTVSSALRMAAGRIRI